MLNCHKNEKISIKKCQIMTGLSDIHFICFHENFHIDLKIGTHTYLVPKKQLVTFSKPLDQQGCQFQNYHKLLSLPKI